MRYVSMGAVPAKRHTQVPDAGGDGALLVEEIGRASCRERV